jgi:TonB-linked SusC/RagA family outer membrane protein
MIKLFTRKFLQTGKRISRSLVLVIVFFIYASTLHAQNKPIKITGTISDSKGETLIGASIKVKGTGTGVLADVNGKFTLTVPDENATLVFSYIGFNTTEQVVGPRRVINVALTETSSDLNEVVVTGYGQSVKKRDLTGSISTVSAKQIGERQPVTIEDALEGQAAGVLVQNDNGDPNGTGTITIRGMGTLNSGGNPLYVIDGVLNTDANFLNPADIASIEVLKDAASAAIYGSRAANGVIIITTKHGTDGKPMVIGTYTHLSGQLAHELPTLSAAQAREYRLTDKGQNTTQGGANADSVNHFLNADNDFEKLLLRTASKNTYNVSISGGQKGLTYYTGINYIDDQSIIINSYIHRLQTTINVDYAPSDKFKVTNNLSFAYQNGNNVPLGTTIQQIWERNPWISIYLPSGQLAAYNESKRNLVAYALEQTNLANLYLAQYNTALNYAILKDLRFTTSFNVKFNDYNTQNFLPTAIQIASLGGNATDNGGQVANIEVSWQLQSFLNYTHLFGNYHTIKVTAGFTRENLQDNTYSVGASDFLSEQVFTSNVGTLNPSTGSNPTITNAYGFSTESLLGRFDYNYKEKYILTATFRRDGSSRFGPQNKWGDFFGTGLAWRFTDESFIYWSKGFLDDGKLRFSIGTLGNDQLGSNCAFVNQITFGASNPISSYNGNGTAQLNTILGNPSIKWETTTTQNYGMDLTMLKGRLTFTPEYFVKSTSNLLYTANLPEETGSKTTAVNIGSIRNQGLELTVTGTPITSKNFSWNVSANITFQNPPLVTQLADGIPFYPTGNSATSPYYITQGGHLGDFYVLKNQGVYPYDVSNKYAVNGDRLTPVGVSADGKSATSFLDKGQLYTGATHSLIRNGHVLQGGETIWQDTNNDGVIDNNDKVKDGNAIPKSYWGITNFVTYKQFSLSFTFNAQFGNNVYNQFANRQQANLTGSYSLPTVDFFENTWHKQGDIAKYASINYKDTYGDISSGINSLYIEDGTFIRLASAKLTYNLDTKIASRIAARSISAYVYGDNLLTWTNYTGFDPEFSTIASGSSLTPGLDNGTYPKRREVGFGINIGF